MLECANMYANNIIFANTNTIFITLVDFCKSVDMHVTANLCLEFFWSVSENIAIGGNYALKSTIESDTWE